MSCHVLCSLYFQCLFSLRPLCTSRAGCCQLIRLQPRTVLGQPVLLYLVFFFKMIKLWCMHMSCERQLNRFHLLGIKTVSCHSIRLASSMVRHQHMHTSIIFWSLITLWVIAFQVKIHLSLTMLKVTTSSCRELSVLKNVTLYLILYVTCLPSAVLKLSQLHQELHSPTQRM